jgi:hypothetical protein
MEDAGFDRSTDKQVGDELLAFANTRTSSNLKKNIQWPMI